MNINPVLTISAPYKTDPFSRTEVIQLQESFDLIGKLNLKGKKLSKSHRKIAEFISVHYDKAVYMTAVSLGQAVEVSEST